MSTPKLICLLLLPIYILAIAILASLQLTVVFESRILLAILNTLFIGLISIAIAYLAARIYISSGSLSFLLMGSGMLTFGFSSILAGLSVTLPDASNLMVTIHNSGALASGILQAIGGMTRLSERSTLQKRPWRPVIIAYSSVIIVILLFSLIAALGYTPRFFIPGTGPTALRQFVLISAMNFYLVSAVLFMIHYATRRSDFVYWYAMSLAMISVGLFAVILQKTVGGPIGWLGRSAQYIGGMFGLMAVFNAVRASISKQAPFEKSIEFLFEQTSAALKESEERFRNLVELSPDGICIHVDGRYVFANSAMAHIVGLLDASEVIGKHALDFVHADSKELVRERIKQGIADGLPAPLVEEKYLRADGTIIYVEVATVPTTFKGQKATQVVIRDITDRKKADAIIQERTEALESANMDLEYFAYVASHDLKEPLRKISSFTEMLSRRYTGQLDEKAEKYIWFIVDGTKRMEALIEDLLTYSRLGASQLSVQPMSAENLVEQAIGDLEQIIKESGAEITHDVLPVVQVNPIQFGQLIRNLVHNAVKFRGSDKPRVHISAEKTDDYWVFSVRDNGIGIDPKQSERIFKIFQRLHTRDEYSGTGIGLAVAKKIVERHGGRIWVESVPGKGSTFYFTVPEI